MSAAKALGSARLPALAGYAAAALLLPLLAVEQHASSWAAAAGVVGVLVATAAAILVVLRIPRPGLGWLGGVLVLVGAWLVTQSTPGPTTWFLGLVIGVGVGVGVPRIDLPRAGWGLVPGVAQFALLAFVIPEHAAVIGGALYGLALAAVAVADRTRPRGRTSRSMRVVALSAAVVTASVTCWIGANSPTATWFGSLVSHGSRARRDVSITFDDGPNVHYSLKIAKVLDDHGAKGTFFSVGKALDARPDVSRALMRDGHLLGNHSYQHDELRWLDPRYPELERTQQAFRRELGVCPTFFRPPHGQHTPFMARVVADHGMTMVTWDVSAGDFATRDPHLVVSRILDHVHPGSIIDLHDGLDGDLTADRSVLLKALPSILRGLEHKGLRPVRLDKMLGKPGYGRHC